MSTNDCCPPTSCSSRNGWLIAAGLAVATPVIIGIKWIAYSTLVIDHHLPLSPAIEADQQTLTTDAAGTLNVYTDRSPTTASGVFDGAGRPLLLIHSVNAAASAFEMRPIFDHYRGQRPVYALDLPGYGFSDRTDAAQTPEAFAGAIVDVIDKVIGEPADVIALSLGCEFAARAALQRPDLFHSLAFISPTGFNAAGTGRATQQAVEQDKTEGGVSDTIESTVGTSAVRSDRHTAQHRVLLEAEFRRAGAARADRLRVCHGAPAGREVYAAALHQRTALYARRAIGLVRAAGCAHAGDP